MEKIRRMEELIILKLAHEDVLKFSKCSGISIEKKI